MKNIVLCCAAGMSTSMLVQRMKEAAQKKGIEVSIKAVPVAEFKDNGRGGYYPARPTGEVRAGETTGASRPGR